MMRALLLAAALLLLPAPAIADTAESREPMPAIPADREPRPVNSGVFDCTEGFTLVKTEAGYQFKGKLETPTPGYKWEIEGFTERRDGDLHGVLALSAPEGMALTVIDTMEISYDIPREQQISYLRLGVKKSFNWGPDQISCKARE